jgi:hypothetical protein
MGSYYISMRVHITFLCEVPQATSFTVTFRSEVKKHLSVPFRNAIFRGIIAMERCRFAQLLKVVHSVSDTCFFAPLWKAIRYSVKRSLIQTQNICKSKKVRWECQNFNLQLAWFVHGYWTTSYLTEWCIENSQHVKNKNVHTVWNKLVYSLM